MKADETAIGTSHSKKPLDFRTFSLTSSRFNKPERSFPRRSDYSLPSKYSIGIAPIKDAMIVSVSIVF